MTATILHFTPRAELSARANVEAFVELCRRSDVLKAAAQFEANVWKTGFLKGKNAEQSTVFSTMEAAKLAQPEPVLPEPFLNFAKASIVYLHDKRPVVSQSQRIAALRCLEASLRERSKDSQPTAVTVEILDGAVDLARGQLGDGAAYRVAGQLVLLANLMRDKGFAEVGTGWHHGLKKPSELGSRISKQALEARQEKLPSAAALRALGGIFDQAISPVDILVSSDTALMLCAPERVNEVMRLERNCLVEGEGRFKGKLGLRWPGSKLAADAVKWLPTQMVPIARKAIAKLLKLSAPANEVAKWYTAHPRSLFLHDDAKHLRSRTVLTEPEIGLLLWGPGVSTGSVKAWVKGNGMKPMGLMDGSTGYRFEDVERVVLSMLPPTFPFVPGDPSLRCKDAVHVVRRTELHPNKATYLCMFVCVDQHILAARLGSRSDMTTIFERYDYTEDDGSRIDLNSHMLRHYLNMLAQVGGLSSAEIAIFSGREDERHNRNYDHRSSDELQAPIKQALDGGFTGDLLPVSTETRKLISRSEFKANGIAAAHTTDFGWCMHNFASEPCQMYRDCINCEEQECVKGDTHKEANLRLAKDEAEYLLRQAREALSDEEYGADRWVEHQSRTLERINALLALYGDPSVPAGARIRLNLANAPLIMNGAATPVKRIPMVSVRAVK